MTLSAPNNPVDARRKTSRRAESRRMAARRGTCGKPGKAAIRARRSDPSAPRSVSGGKPTNGGAVWHSPLQFRVRRMCSKWRQLGTRRCCPAGNQQPNDRLTMFLRQNSTSDRASNAWISTGISRISIDRFRQRAIGWYPPSPPSRRNSICHRQGNSRSGRQKGPRDQPLPHLLRMRSLQTASEHPSTDSRCMLEGDPDNICM